jgi:hypothetical protein
MKWQPIETAPKDRVDLLLFCPDRIERHWVASDMSPHICIGRFSHGWVSTDVSVQVVDYGGMTGASDESELELVHPTHWMPLPKPPIDSEERK